MRVERSLAALLMSAAVAATGCHNNLFQGPDPIGCEQGRLAYNLPPAARLMEPGPGVGGPGPGVIPPMGGGFGAMGPMYPGGGANAVMPASYEADGCGCAPGCVGGYAMGGGTSQIAFLGENGIQVNWDVSAPGMFDSATLVTPGRQDFQQGAIYRLRISGIPGRDGVELFPTLEVAPVTPRTDAFLAHAPIPVQFTTEDFDQVTSGNFVTKVIYLPDPEFQELTLTGVETLVSTRLDPGVDPIAEADRRGSILAILRMGNKDFRVSGGSFNGGPFGPSGPGGVICAAYEQEGGSPEMAPGMAPQYDAGAEGNYDGSYDGGYDTGYGNPGYNGNGGSGYGGGNCAGGCSNGSCGVGGGYGGGGGMPLGMPTAGFRPAPVPPNMIAGGPTWGMPITGTPIGLPGPPHVPLGSPAGLQRHVMKNRTRVHMPAPVMQMTMSVKQRPGLNYPRPVNHVYVDEVHREPGGLFPGIANLFHRDASAGNGGGPPHHYNPNYCQ